MNVIVTGGAGFIGSAMVKKLIAKGHEVLCLDDLSTGKLSNLPLASGQLIFRQVDVNDHNQLLNSIGSFKPEWVFHYAATVGVQYTLANPCEVEDDEKGIANVFELAKMFNIKKVAIASSSEVYDDGHNLTEANGKLVLEMTPYQRVKRQGEIIAKTYSTNHDIISVSLRIFNTFGPNQRGTSYGFVIPIFIEQALKSQPLVIFGDGEATRDFVYIDDNVNYTYELMCKIKAGHYVFNVCNGKPVSIIHLAKKILALTRSGSIIKFAERRQDTLLRGGSARKLKRYCDYRPEYSLYENLLKTIEYVKNGME
jgi:UDP-glucose 4-epimerase